MADFSKKWPVVEDVQPLKILFLGDDQVGKSTFIDNYRNYMSASHGTEFSGGPFLRFTQSLFNIKRGGKQVPIQLLDLQGGLTKKDRKQQYPIEVKSAVICFAIDNPNSFDNVRRVWIPEFQQKYPRYIRMFLLGLKSDARVKILPSNSIVTVEKVIETLQGCEFSGNYYECSCQENPEEARICMEKLISEILMYLPCEFPSQEL
ncbi:hypothetical protein AVEN_242464-1 [Araneus ventricosus]|uniref:Uncharacterized protein n=1 Tax=Araneus ventricosus TaxID=182803 RepID=A0A4Y2S9D2_ARAVE|nr:hypothetical protein AVEN_242464-1 [Araneus ventricosus]